MKQWLIGIFAASMLTAIAMAILPKGSARRGASLAGGLLMILAALSPIAEISGEDISAAISKYRFRAEAVRTGVDIQSSDVMEAIIREQTAAYILDKAGSMGLDIAVEVETERASDGWPYPASVKVSGQVPPDKRRQLEALMENELAIGSEEQEWS